MSNFDSIVFDLDGTLWNTTPSCVVAWNQCVEKLGLSFREIVPEDVMRVTGKAHDECIRLTFKGLEEHHLQSLIDLTQTEDSRVIEQLGGHIYPGVEEGLPLLAEKYRLFIVSNCQSGYIETFLAYSGFGSYFRDFECFGNTGKSKGHNLQQVISRNGLKRPVMVGDASGDEVAARECGVPFYFMTYGFGTTGAPDKTFENFQRFVDALM